MCGRNEPAAEVEIPHATNEQRRINSIGSTQVMCAAVCEECGRAIVAAWARYGAAGYARWKAERDAARKYPETVDE
jgi:hypothetical protein